MIDIHEELEVPASPERVWLVLSDPDEVVACIPGAAIVGRREDGTLDISVPVKFGPTRISFSSQVALRLDPSARRGEATVQSRDSVGGTRVRSTTSFGVTSQGSGSRVAIDGRAEVSGRLAGLIEGGASMVVKRIAAEFGRNLAERCQAA